MSQGFLYNSGIAYPLAVNLGGTGVTSSTGTGSVVLSNSPSLVSPTLGAATATSLVFSPTTSGILGVTDGSNAAAGVVGQVLSAVNSGGLVLVSATPANITSLSLTAGSWIVFPSALCSNSLNDMTQTLLGLNTVSATLPASDLWSEFAVSGATPFTGYGSQLPSQLFSVTSPTTIYLVARCSFGSGTTTAYGRINALRIH